MCVYVCTHACVRGDSMIYCVRIRFLDRAAPVCWRGCDMVVICPLGRVGVGTVCSDWQCCSYVWCARLFSVEP